MNRQELSVVQQKERSTDSLQHLRETFYEDVGEYIEQLRQERSEAAARTGDPFGSEEVQRLTDEIKATEEVVKSIYDRRVGKIVKRASFQAAGMPTDEDEGLTHEEADLFADLVARIEANKDEVLDVLSGEGTTVPAGDASPSPDGDASPEPESSPAPGSASDEPSRTPGKSTDPTDPGDEVTAGETSDESADGGDGPDRTTVRITRSVGEIFGVDEREYVLEAEDVVALPTANAEPLVARDAAEKLE